MTDVSQTDFDAAEAPMEWPPAHQALWWLRKGNLETGAEWERAHLICQSNEGESDHDLVHALAHLIEGDLPNADYWYRRAGSARQGDAAAEWQRIALVLAGKSRPEASNAR